MSEGFGEAEAGSALDRNMRTAYTAPGVLSATSADTLEPRVGPCLVHAYSSPALPDGVIDLVAGAEHGAAKITVRARDLRTLARLAEGKEVKPEHMARIGVQLLDLDEMTREEANADEPDEG